MPIQLSGSGSITGVSTLTSLASLDVTGSVSVGGTLIYDDVTNIDSLGIVTARSDVHVGAGLSVTGISTFNDYLDINGSINIDASRFTYDASTNQLKLADDVQLRFGDGNDLRIYHSGTDGNSYIQDTGPGGLKLTGSDIYLRNVSDHDMIHAQSGGYVKLYHNNNQRLETTNAGIQVTGTVTTSGTGEGSAALGSHLDLGDNQKVRLGASDDLDMYHDGTDSYIRNNTGQLLIRGNDIKLNNYLGTKTHAEFADGGLTTGAIDLSAISSSISDTAVDVFIYDTRKDSDGGAWRKRTQHASWYNETLNTSTRGSRKEFPAVAVIVAENDTLTIYDGDDPDLPMWMVFNAGNANGNNMIGRTNENTTCTSMLNGLLCVGRDHFGFHMINFIADRARFKENGYDTPYTLPIGTNINGGNSWLGVNVDGNDLVNDLVNDVAMTVLPNAPIDDATGLPVPTIAVATNGGISIIKDDGEVSSKTITGGIANHYIDFLDNGNIVVEQGYQYTTVLLDYTAESQAYTSSLSNSEQYTHLDSGWEELRFPYFTVGGSGVSGNYKLTSFKNNFASAHSGGLVLVDRNAQSPSNGLIAGITTSYNTGWMQGDIKGAFLSDTDTTNATYTTVADDWATASAWTKQPNISVSSTGSGTSGTLSITGSNSGSNVYFFNPITVEANTDYVVIITFGAYHANAFLINNTQYSTSGSVLDIHGLSGLTRGGHFNSGSNTTLYIQGWQFSSTATTITDITIQKVSEKDLSLNNKGLQVFGTVTKSAVATGAELVGYSFGNSNANYLKQPPNLDFQFGTGDFSVMAWINMPDYSQTGFIFDRSDSGGNERIAWYMESDNLKFYTYDGANHSEIGLNTVEIGSAYDGKWVHCVATRHSSGLLEEYINGVLIHSQTSTVRQINNEDAHMVIGGRYNSTSGNEFDGSIALLRITGSIPSPEQVKKMYEEEKVLFQENAKATLYGSSDAVTALAYDDDTELLHVGTSAGRSDFQGLCRINNTTTAVTTAISASDDLIAEQ